MKQPLSSSQLLPPVEQKLERLSSKAKEWYNLELTQKLSYLDFALKALNSPRGLALVGESSHAYATQLLKARGQEYDFCRELDSVLTIVPIKTFLDAYSEAFRVLVGEKNSTEVLSKLETRLVRSDGSVKSNQGQGTSQEHDQEVATVVTKVFPLFPHERNSAMKDAIGEVYFSPQHVASPHQIRAYDVKALQCRSPGVCVVLGAGNYQILAIVDLLYQLFQKNQVVFLKHHPIRAELEPLIRFLFLPLFESGYLDSELHFNAERCQELVYSRHVQGVHMTGGKQTHDALVWGSTPSEQDQRRVARSPKLMAHMTAELGAVTPYIVTPVQYTAEELDLQAQVVVSAKWVNGGASCNAPQVIVMSEQWSQRQAFIDRIEHHWKQLYCPTVYYPGTSDRVEGFRSHYSNENNSTRSAPCAWTITAADWMGKLPDYSNEMHMPLFTISLSNVDISTKEGMDSAKAEYAFQNEAFGPVLAFVTLKVFENQPTTDEETTTPSLSQLSDEDVDTFMSQAVTFCNECLFGTLSCSLMVPDWAQHKAYIERTIVKLHYGGVALNAWSANIYAVKGGPWGGYDKVESLENAQSGLGQVNNAFFFTHAEKTVVRHSILDTNGHMLFTVPRTTLIRVYKALLEPKI